MLWFNCLEVPGRKAARLQRVPGKASPVSAVVLDSGRVMRLPRITAVLAGEAWGPANHAAVFLGKREGARGANGKERDGRQGASDTRIGANRSGGTKFVQAAADEPRRR